MRAIDVCMIWVLVVGAWPGGGGTEGQRDVCQEVGIALPFEAWEFAETDGQLWLRFHRLAEKDEGKGPLAFRMPLDVSLAGVDTKFVPLVYQSVEKGHRGHFRPRPRDSKLPQGLPNKGFCESHV